MRNIIKIFRNMFKDELNIKKIDVDLPIIYNIAKRAGFKLKRNEKNDNEYLRVVERKTQVVVLSTTQKKVKRAKFACLSDIHAGAKGIDINKLKAFLNKCKKVKIRYLFIAGDLFEGCNMFANHENILEENTPEGQARILFNELKDYNFHVIFINGNHDYSFETNHQANPNRILADMLMNAKKKVSYIDSFYGDAVIENIGIRLVHLDDSYANTREYPCVKYAKEQINARDYTQNPDTGEMYKLHVVISGHIHRHEIYQYKEVLVFQPGSIKEKDLDQEKRIGFIVRITVEGEILKEYNIS